MEKIPISLFKAKCLRILQEVHDKKKRVIVTKRGTPLVEIVPTDEEADKKIPLRDTVLYMGDIISPVAEEDWEALK